ncbi:hypothetical protein BJ912DRAFT_924159 [Pholiota molesta]|nr:hypothetical protein BJ912DRAFT_924159 [Pholiota molesta]
MDGGVPPPTLFSTLSATKVRFTFSWEKFAHVNVIIAGKYATVASATVLVWDIALTFDREVSRVWRVKKTVGTTLFFLQVQNRYLPPLLFGFDLFSQFVSAPSINIHQYSYLVSIAIIECVLVMRTQALYPYRRVLLFLSTLCIASMVVMLTCFLLVFKMETFLPADEIGLRGCLSGCTSPLCRPLLIAFWVPFLAFETLLAARMSGSTTILRILARDGILYYIVIMSVSICNFLIWILDPFASYLAVGLMKSLQATICSRLLLNLRGIVESPTPTASQFEFAYPGSLIRLQNLGQSTDALTAMSTTVRGEEFHA